MASNLSARALSTHHPSPGPVPPEETREKLLAAAQAVFVEVGFYDATVREICRRAGVNLALINYHFKDKLGLYTEVLKNATMTSKLVMLDRANDPDADPVDLLLGLITVMIRNMSRTDHAFDILMRQERLRPTPAMAFHIEETMRPGYIAMCTLVGRILQLPAEHQRCRLATHSIIGQIKHFGEPERLLSQLDPAILAGKAPEEIADFITRFSLSYLQADVERCPLPRARPDRADRAKKRKPKVRLTP